MNQVRVPSNDVTLSLQIEISAKAKLIVLYVHGACSHGGSGKHLGVAMKKQHRGYAALDLRGHGESTGVPAYVKDFSQYAEDVETAVRYLHGQWPSAKILLAGNSMGAVVSLKVLRRKQVDLAGAVLLSPAVELRHKLPWYYPVAAALFSPIPGLDRVRFPTGLAPERSTHDSIEQKWLRTDKLGRSFMTPRMFRQMLKSMDEERMSDLVSSVPLLVLIGTEDAVIAPEAMHALIDSLKAHGNQVSSAEFEGLFHMLLLEKRRDEVLAAITQWIKSLQL